MDIREQMRTDYMLRINYEIVLSERDGKIGDLTSDLEFLSKWIVCRYLEEDNRSCDYCIFCGIKYGNVEKNFIEKGIGIPHDEKCPVLMAQKYDKSSVIHCKKDNE